MLTPFSFRRWLGRVFGSALTSVDDGSLAGRPSRVAAQWRRTGKRVRPRLEELEDRLAPATTVSIADASTIEPAPGGTVNMDFTVTRTGDLSAPLAVGYTTVPGTAQPSVDFTPQTGTVTFAPGAATATIAIPIMGNGVYNFPDLNFSVQLLDYQPQVTFATGKRPVAVAVADINGDGKPDLVVANYADINSVSVLLNTTPAGVSTPTFAPQQSFPAGGGASSLVVADFNGDGLPDIAVVNPLANTVSVLLNTTALGAATASFAAPASFHTGFRPIALAVADINADGKPDLAVANAVSQNVAIFLNTTPTGASVPTFATPMKVNTARLVTSMALADLNGDSKPDLIVATGDRIAYVYMNNTTAGASTATFAVPVAFEMSLNRGPVAIAVGDLNGDGKPDFAFADDVNYASILLNTTAAGAGTPSFSTSATFDVGSSPASVVMADVNGDGKPDLVFADYGSGDISVLINTTAAGATTPSFAPAKTYATGSHPSYVAVADVNGDGLPDFIAANATDNTVSVLVKQPAFGSFTRTKATGTITESDLAVAQLAAASDSVNVGAGTYNFTVNLAPATQTPTFIPFSLSGTAVSGTDYELLSPNPVVIQPTATSVTITINVLTPPPGLNKTLTLTLGNPTNAKLGTIQAETLTIVQPNSLSLADASALEPAPGGTVNMVFTATRTGDASPLTVGYTTVPGTAQPNTDFAPQTGTATFAAGAATTTISIPVFDNGVYNNPNLTFSVELTGFSQPTSFNTGDGAVAVAVGDFNGDGKPDVVTANRYANTASVFLNTTTPGASTPTFASQSPLFAGSAPFSVAVADFNGDGKPDIVVANSGHQGVSVFLNTTAPGATTASFAPAATFPLTGYLASVAVADFNGDGKPDVVLTSSSGAVEVMLNTTPSGAATPTFTAWKSFATGARPTDVAVADVNGDGKPDIIVANYADNTVSVLLNTTPTGATTPSFASQQIIHTGTKPRFLTLADLNGDGRPDLIVTNSGDNTVSVFLNQTAAGASAVAFGPQQTWATGANPVSVAAVDVNGDGRPDLVVVNNSLDSSVSVLLNLTAPGAASAAFAPQQTFHIGSFPFSLAVADFNGDGRPDLVTSTSDTPSRSTIAMLLNAPIVATGTIIDTDPYVSLASATQTVHEDDGTFSVAVNLSGAVPTDVTIPFTLGGTAVAGKNYTGVSASPLVIPAGQTSGTITGVLINDDRLDTVDKTLSITLGTPLGAKLGAITTDALTIQESLPAPAVGNVSGLEGTSGTAGPVLTPFTFQLRLPAPLPQDVTYDVFTTDGTAKAGVNYVSITAGDSSHGGTVTFPKGSAFATVTVYVIAGSLPVTPATARATFTLHVADPATPPSRSPAARARSSPKPTWPGPAGRCSSAASTAWRAPPA
jgi:hypothetical protein